VDAAVLEAYGLAHDQGWLADRALEKVLRREKKLWASERRAAAEAVYGIVRWQGLIDWLLGGRPSLALRYAAWLARFAGVAPADAARRLGLPASALAPLADAERRLAAVTDPLERFALETSLPRWIVERFVAERGMEDARALAAAMNARAPLTVRTNLLVGDREALSARLRSEGVGATPTRHSPWGLVLDGHQNAFALKSFRDGAFEIQDEGSQLIAFACQARPGWTVVDACAGAGGKSLALAMEMRNKGTLHALDTDAGRLADARKRARRAHVHNLRFRTIGAGEEALEQLADLAGEAGKADLVLVDAPCSGLGTLRRKPDARWRLEPGDPEEFAGLQRALVARFARLVRPGGRLVYATCSIGRTENGDVADFAEREVGLVPAPLGPLLGEDRARALGAVGGRVELYPHLHGTDGFFVAAFEKPK
jgi:16S rRNA (cytosine967-C5)-methyltransferase